MNYQERFPLPPSPHIILILSRLETGELCFYAFMDIRFDFFFTFILLIGNLNNLPLWASANHYHGSLACAVFEKTRVSRGWVVTLRGKRCLCHSLVFQVSCAAMWGLHQTFCLFLGFELSSTCKIKLYIYICSPFSWLSLESSSEHLMLLEMKV